MKKKKSLEIPTDKIVVHDKYVDFGGHFSVALTSLMAGDAITSALASAEDDGNDTAGVALGPNFQPLSDGNVLVFSERLQQKYTPRTLGLMALAVLEFFEPDHPLVNSLNSMLD